MISRLSNNPSLCSRGGFRLRIGIWHFRPMKTSGGVNNKSGKFGNIGNHSNNRRKRNMFFNTYTRLHPHNRGWSNGIQHRGVFKVTSNMRNERLIGKKNGGIHNPRRKADSRGRGYSFVVTVSCGATAGLVLRLRFLGLALGLWFLGLALRLRLRFDREW